jgi:DNA-binding MarR family transcriptional regulator
MTKESSPQSLLAQIEAARRQVQSLSASFKEKSGFTASQASVLVAILHNEGVSQTALVEKTGIDRSTLAELLIDGKLSSH